MSTLQCRVPASCKTLSNQCLLYLPILSSSSRPERASSSGDWEWESCNGLALCFWTQVGGVACEPSPVALNYKDKSNPALQFQQLFTIVHLKLFLLGPLLIFETSWEHWTAWRKCSDGGRSPPDDLARCFQLRPRWFRLFDGATCRLILSVGA